MMFNNLKPMSQWLRTDKNKMTKKDFKIVFAAFMTALLPIITIAQTDPTPAISEIRDYQNGSGNVTVIGILEKYGTSDEPKWMEATIRSRDDNSFSQTVYNPTNKSGKIVKLTPYALPTVSVPKSGYYVVNVGVGGCFGWKTVYGQSQTIYVNKHASPQPNQPPPPSAYNGKTTPQILIRYVVHDTYEYAEFVNGGINAPTGSTGWSLGISGSVSATGPGAAVQLQYSTNKDKIYGIQYFPSKTTNAIKVNYFAKTEYGDYITLYGKSYPTEKGSGDNRKVIIGDGAHHYYILARYLGTEPRQNIQTQSYNTQPTTQQQSQTYNTSHFIKTGNAVLRNQGGRSYIGDIDANSGFKFTVNCDVTKSASVKIMYQSDVRGGKLIVNGVTQNIDFSSTNWNWGTKDVQIQLRQGQNTIEFYGGYRTNYAPDISEITVSW